MLREHAQPRFLHHQPLIQSDNMKWRFPGQRAPAILDGTAQADIVRALTLCRIMRRGDDVRQTKKRLVDPELPWRTGSIHQASMQAVKRGCPTK